MKRVFVLVLAVFLSLGFTTTVLAQAEDISGSSGRKGGYDQGNRRGIIR